MAVDEEKLDDILSKYENEEEYVEVEESEEEPQNLPEVINTPSDTNVQVGQFMQTGGNIIQQNYASGKKTMEETVEDITHLTIAAKALDDQDSKNAEFIEKSIKQQQEKLSQGFEAGILKAEAEKLEAKKKKAEAFYTMFRPILEFDFSNLNKIKKVRVDTPAPKVVKKGEKEGEQKPVYRYDRVEPKTYADRSYGIPLMVLMLCLLTIPYCVVTIILSVFNAINEIFMQIANYGKSALIICSTMAGMTVIGLVIYVLLLVIQSAFGVTIFH